VSKEFIPKKDAVFLAYNVLKILLKNVEKAESGKVAILMLLETFAKEDYFTKKECEDFLQKDFRIFSNTMTLFKVKKQILPCLIAISKHISYELFQEKVLTTFVEYCSDEIWGVRRVCLEILPEIIKLLQPTETTSMIKLIDFVKKSFTDSSKWVKNQAF